MIPRLWFLLAAMLLGACARTFDAPAPPAPVVATPASGTRTVPVGSDPRVGSAAMLPTRTIADNLAATPALSTLTTAIGAIDLKATLAGAGPFTVFAPSDAAFGRLAPGVVASLMKPENKTTLARVLRYHVVAGTITTTDLLSRIRAGNGTTTLTTLLGVPIRVTMTADVITLTSETGNQSYIEAADLRQANGLVHVVNGVLVPALH